MFSKTYCFVLSFVCYFYFGGVFANIFINLEENVTDIYRTHTGSVHFGPINMRFINEENIVAEIYLHYMAYYNRKKYGTPIMVDITFEEDSIVLNCKKKSALYKYHYNENGIKRLEKFIQDIDNNIKFKVVKIYKINNDDVTPLINDTIYDKEILLQLKNIQHLSLWNYVKNDLIILNSIEKSYTTLEDLINNSTTYKRSLQSTLDEAIKIMYHRSIRYVILLSAYAYEALFIKYDTTSYWTQILEVSDKISSAMYKLDRYNSLSYDLDLFKDQENDGENKIALFKGMVNKYVYFLLTPEKLKKYGFINEFTVQDLCNNQVLPQRILNKLLKGFPKQQDNEEPYNFHDIQQFHDTQNFHDLEKNLDEIMKKLEIIFSLIHAEYNTIV